MKKIPVLLFLISLSFVSFVSAQQGARIAFVRPSMLIQAYGPNTETAQLVTDRDTELTELANEITKLQEKSNSATGLTPDERARASLLVKTFDEVQKNYQADIDKASAPILTSINESISEVAMANGYDLVFDAEVSVANGMIVFANFAVLPDITDLVIAQIKAKLGQ